MASDIHVERATARGTEISIYDRFGGGGIELSTEEAEHVRYRLEELL